MLITFYFNCFNISFFVLKLVQSKYSLIIICSVLIHVLYLLRYGMWRVLTGKHKSMEYSMMEAGHTKFHPDWHFGLWKVCQELP